MKTGTHHFQRKGVFNFALVHQCLGLRSGTKLLAMCRVVWWAPAVSDCLAPGGKTGLADRSQQARHTKVVLTVC